MATVELTTLAMICIIVIGIPIGVLSAVKANSPIDHFVRSLSVAGVALPGFMLGMLLQMTFYGGLHWLPLQGRMTSAILLDHHFPARDRPVSRRHLACRRLGRLSRRRRAYRAAARNIVAGQSAPGRAHHAKSDGGGAERGPCAHGLRLWPAAPRRLFPLCPESDPDPAADRHRPDLWLSAWVARSWRNTSSTGRASAAMSSAPSSSPITRPPSASPLFLATAYLIINLAVDLLYFAVDPRLRHS